MTFRSAFFDFNLLMTVISLGIILFSEELAKYITIYLNDNRYLIFLYYDCYLMLYKRLFKNYNYLYKGVIL